jgi:hypothetical protein
MSASMSVGVSSVSAFTPPRFGVNDVKLPYCPKTRSAVVPDETGVS